MTRDESALANSNVRIETLLHDEEESVSSHLLRGSPRFGGRSDPSS